MKASINTGAFDLYNPALVPTSGVSGVVQCEAGARFRIKNALTLSSSLNNVTKSGITSVAATVWKTPSVPYYIDYASVRFTTSPVGAKTSGANFSSFTFALMIEDSGGVGLGGGNHGMVNAPTLTFTGTSSATYNIGVNRSLFSNVIDGGFIFSAYNIAGQEGAVGGTDTGFGSLFHAYSSAWFNQDVWLSFVSEPTVWSLTCSLVVEISGMTLG